MTCIFWSSFWKQHFTCGYCLLQQNFTHRKMAYCASVGILDKVSFVMIFKWFCAKPPSKRSITLGLTYPRIILFANDFVGFSFRVGLSRKLSKLKSSRFLLYWIRRFFIRYFRISQEAFLTLQMCLIFMWIWIVFFQTFKCSVSKFSLP